MGEFSVVCRIRYRAESLVFQQFDQSVEIFIGHIHLPGSHDEDSCLGVMS